MHSQYEHVRCQQINNNNNGNNFLKILWLTSLFSLLLLLLWWNWHCHIKVHCDSMRTLHCLKYYTVILIINGYRPFELYSIGWTRFWLQWKLARIVLITIYLFRVYNHWMIVTMRKSLLFYIFNSFLVSTKSDTIFHKWHLPQSFVFKSLNNWIWRGQIGFFLLMGVEFSNIWWFLFISLDFCSKIGEKFRLTSATELIFFLKSKHETLLRIDSIYIFKLRSRNKIRIDDGRVVN